MKYLIPLTSLCLLSSLSALPINNPAAPQLTFKGLWMREDAFAGVKMGYEKESVSNRGLFIQGEEPLKLNEASFLKNLGTFTLNYLDRLELYGSLGSIQGRLSYAPLFTPLLNLYELKSGWVAGCGGRLLLSQWGNCVLGMDGKAEWINPHVNLAIQAGSPLKESYAFQAFEWQTSLALSYTANFLTPYIGAKYSSMKGTLKALTSPINPQDVLKLKSSHRLGMSIGFTLSPGSLFDITFESQMIDEEGWLVGGQLKF
ncbi:MAG: hypothetical protein QRY71_04610 [Candidatus Rhabdochlamydia sp.]